MERLKVKFKTAADIVPGPVFGDNDSNNDYGVIHFGTSSLVMQEAIDQLKAKDIALDTMRIRAFPFAQSIYDFIANHKKVFVVEQNINGQMRSLLINEGNLDSAKLTSVLHFDGMPITSSFVSETIADDLTVNALNQSLIQDAKEIS